MNTFHTRQYAIKDPTEISKRRMHTNLSGIGYCGFGPGCLHLTLIRLIQASNTYLYIGNGHVVFCKKIKLFLSALTYFLGGLDVVIRINAERV